MVSQWIKASRVYNLIIVASLQAIFLFLVLRPLIHAPTLSVAQSITLILITVLITLGGYYINDYFDSEIDRRFKSDWHSLSKKSLLIAYLLTSILGLALAVWLAIQLDLISYLPIYFVSIALLYYYSYRLKHLPLIGNVVVALFCAGSLLILHLAEWPAISSLASSLEKSTLKHVSIFFTVFAFLLTLVRELVKDVEDLEGDKAAGLATIAVKHGVTWSSRFIWGATALLECVIIWWWLTTTGRSNLGLTIGLTLILGIGIIMIYLKSRPEVLQQNSKELSGLIKLMMVVGLVYLILFSRL